MPGKRTVSAAALAALKDKQRLQKRTETEAVRQAALISIAIIMICPSQRAGNETDVSRRSAETPERQAPLATRRRLHDVSAAAYFRCAAWKRENGSINEAIWGEEAELSDGLMLPACPESHRANESRSERKRDGETGRERERETKREERDRRRDRDEERFTNLCVILAAEGWREREKPRVLRLHSFQRLSDQIILVLIIPAQSQRENVGRRHDNVWLVPHLGSDAAPASRLVRTL